MGYSPDTRVNVRQPTPADSMHNKKHKHTSYFANIGPLSISDEEEVKSNQRRRTVAANYQGYIREQDL